MKPDNSRSDNLPWSSIRRSDGSRQQPSTRFFFASASAHSRTLSGRRSFCGSSGRPSHQDLWIGKNVFCWHPREVPCSDWMLTYCCAALKSTEVHNTCVFPCGSTATCTFLGFPTDRSRFTRQVVWQALKDGTEHNTALLFIWITQSEYWWPSPFANPAIVVAEDTVSFFGNWFKQGRSFFLMFLSPLNAFELAGSGLQQPFRVAAWFSWFWLETICLSISRFVKWTLADINACP